MKVDEIAPGLWRWTAPHPDWTPEELEGGAGWEEEVSCVFYEADETIVLIDPLVPGEEDERERFLSHLDDDVARTGKPVAIVLTIHYHERSAAELAERLGAEVWAEERASERLELVPERTFSAGDPLPGELVAIDARRRDEVLLWIPRHGALVAGDVFLGDGDNGVRVAPASWLPDEVTPAQFRADLSGLLTLPIERILLAHGEPVLKNAHAALAAALAP